MKAAHKRELTGRHVFLMLAVFFGVMFTVNGLFAYLAVKSFSGEDVPRSYRQGLEYNQVIKAREAQAELGWHVKANSFPLEDKTRIVIHVEDGQMHNVTGLQINGVLRHPSDKALDQAVTFRDTGKGRYEADIMLPHGAWTLKVEANDQRHHVYKLAYDIWVN